MSREEFIAEYGQEPEFFKLTELSALRIGPEDILVIRHPGLLSIAAVVRLRDSFQSQLPGRKVVVLEEGMNLGVLQVQP